MREILFRGKGLDDGKWHFGSLQVFKGYSIFDNIWNNFVPVHSKTVGQLTGLRDKNSRRIFEGDILRCTHCGEIRSVVFDEEMTAFEFDKRDPVENPDGSCLCVDHREFEVIGNIHDNPELGSRSIKRVILGGGDMEVVTQTQKTLKINPCDCGSYPTFVCPNNGWTDTWLECPNCGKRTYNMGGFDYAREIPLNEAEKKAVRAWNNKCFRE